MPSKSSLRRPEILCTSCAVRDADQNARSPGLRFMASGQGFYRSGCRDLNSGPLVPQGRRDRPSGVRQSRFACSDAVDRPYVAFWFRYESVNPHTSLIRPRYVVCGRRHHGAGAGRQRGQRLHQFDRPAGTRRGLGTDAAPSPVTRHDRVRQCGPSTSISMTLRRASSTRSSS